MARDCLEPGDRNQGQLRDTYFDETRWGPGCPGSGTRKKGAERRGSRGVTGRWSVFPKAGQLLYSSHMKKAAVLLMTAAADNARGKATAPSAAASPASPNAAVDPNRSYQELETTARRLAASIGMPPERQALALDRLRTAFQRGKVAAFSSGGGINGVFAYQLGEGGFLVKVKKGTGLATILGEARDVPHHQAGEKRDSSRGPCVSRALHDRRRLGTFCGCGRRQPEHHPYLIKQPIIFLHTRHRAFSQGKNVF